jgi:hypothetical protein
LGQLEFREGNLADAAHRDFLTHQVTASFVNNFNGVFAERSETTLDFFVAGLLALMAPGARMATLHPLPLQPSKTTTNAHRLRNGLAESDDASFYELEVLNLGPANRCVSWSEGNGNKKKIKVYLYTRVQQSTAQSVVLCCNKGCLNAQNAVPIAAVEINSDRPVLKTCDCKLVPHTVRSSFACAENQIKKKIHKSVVTNK